MSRLRNKIRGLIVTYHLYFPPLSPLPFNPNIITSYTSFTYYLISSFLINVELSHLLFFTYPILSLSYFLSLISYFLSLISNPCLSSMTSRILYFPLPSSPPPFPFPFTCLVSPVLLFTLFSDISSLYPLLPYPPPPFFSFFSPHPLSLSSYSYSNSVRLSLFPTLTILPNTNCSPALPLAISIGCSNDCCPTSGMNLQYVHCPCV